MSTRELGMDPRPAVLRFGGGLVLLGCLLAGGPVEAAIFTVNSTGEEVDVAPGNGACLTGVATCTLRAAIMESNALAGTDTIEFSIPAAGPHTITVLAAGRPAITGAVIIDGYSEPGSVANTLAVGSDAVLMIELDGSLTGGGVNGLTISAIGTTIRGLVINRFADYAFGSTPRVP